MSRLMSTLNYMSISLNNRHSFDHAYLCQEEQDIIDHISAVTNTEAIYNI